MKVNAMTVISYFDWSLLPNLGNSSTSIVNYNGIYKARWLQPYYVSYSPTSVIKGDNGGVYKNHTKWAIILLSSVKLPITENFYPE